MIPSLQYANEGTEYNSNMSSEVTMIYLRVSLTRISWNGLNLRALECKGLHSRSVIRIGWSTVGVSMPN